MKPGVIDDFFKEATNAVGEPWENVTQHSPRHTGAVRMIFAGHSDVIVQLFGRWGTTTVLKYIREAPLGAKGGTITQVTEGVAPPMGSPINSLLENILKMIHGPNRARANGLSDLAVEDIAALVLPKLKAPTPSLDTTAVQALIDKAVCTVACEVGRLCQELDGVVGAALPRYVACDNRFDGRVHAPATSLKAYCGYAWRSAKGDLLAKVTTRTGWDNGPQCPRCAKGLLRAGIA